MRVIFICENPSTFFTVFNKQILDDLKKICDTDEVVYKKADILKTSDRFSDAKVIFSTWGMPGFTEDEIKSIFPQLECVFYAAGSVQHFARPFLNCGIKVFSAWAANAVPVAEYTVSQIILAGKGFFALSRLMAQKQPDDINRQKGAYIGNYRTKVGLIGCGMIGSLVANMLKAYDLEVLAFDPFLSDESAQEIGVKKCTLEEIFSTCFVVSNHLANNEKTRRIFNYKLFSTMPEYSTFINTGRGAQVVEDDLVKILIERPDITALLDVTDPEPAPLSHPFYSLPNCFLTPHIAGSIGHEVSRMAEYMVNEFRNFSNGLPYNYEVTLKMLETMA